ncbi:MAG: hypothetical protein RMI56_00710 [Sulfolobales archaeon]|nr:hypothetical protein [Sulfolobales archaeon]MDW8082301.1 hypothetical protein [Sulfolobales archaeon]
MSRAINIVAELSVYYWVFTAVSSIFSEFGVWPALISFTIHLVLKMLNNYRVPLLSITIRDASGLIFDFVEWENSSALIKVRLSGEGELRLFISLCTLVFAGTLILALTGSSLKDLNYFKLLLLFTILSTSTLFYNANSAYIKAIGATIPIIPSVAYATLVNTAIWLIFGDSYLNTFSILINFIAIVVGCDILTIKWAILNNTKSLVIGGLGLRDAVILVPTTSYFILSLVVNAMKFAFSS